MKTYILIDENNIVSSVIWSAGDAPQGYVEYLHNVEIGMTVDESGVAYWPEQ